MRLLLIIAVLLLTSAAAIAQVGLPWPGPGGPATSSSPAATIQDQQLIVLNGVNGIQLVLN